MKDTDVDFSDRAAWEHSCKELWVILGKRFLLLLFKMIDAKAVCLLVDTWLLVHGYIRDLVWFAIVVIVLFGILGLKILTRWKDTGHK